MQKGRVFLLFLGWCIFYSLLYFISLDITGDPPGKEATAFQKVFNYGILFIVSVAGWWFTWQKFQKAFSPAAPPAGTAAACRFGLRNPAAMYYLMVLKLFLLAMGANGLITLSHHTGAARTFYIWNFIILYLYALPFFIIKFGKLKKALSAEALLDERGVTLRIGEKTAVQLPYEAVEQVLIEEATGALLIHGSAGSVCLGALNSRISPFYAAGVERAAEAVRRNIPEKISMTPSLKDDLKRLNIKAPF